MNKKKKPYFWQVLETRRSVRSFESKPVPMTIIEKVLEAATWAPSAHNRQPWRFVVVTKPEVKYKLAEEMADLLYKDRIADGFVQRQARQKYERSVRRIESAPVAVILCLDSSEMDSYPDVKRQQYEETMAVQSVALAGGHLLLAAHAEGLSGLWMCAPLFAAHLVKQTLDLPEHWKPQSIILLGYAANVPEPPARKLLVEVTLYR